MWSQVTYHKLKAFYHEGLGSKTSSFIAVKHNGHCHCTISILKVMKNRMWWVKFPVWGPKPSKQLSPWNLFIQCEAPQHDFRVGSHKGGHPALHWKGWPVHLNDPYLRFSKSDSRFNRKYFDGQRHPVFLNAAAEVPICMLLALARGCNATKQIASSLVESMTGRTWIR